MLQPTVNPCCADALIASLGVNNSSDWLHRNDSYTQTSHTMHNLAMADANIVATGIIDSILFIEFHVIFNFLC